jgi:[acyl-carrier-protein] S-malonyltransferase
MSTVAFLFAGQGAQRVGMAADVAALDGGEQLLALADRALGYSLSGIMHAGPADVLECTEHAQPALLLLGVAQASALRRRGVQPVAMIGHSLGQYAALVAAGAFRLEDALRLVALRGRLMQRAVPSGAGAMAAVIGMPRADVYAACAAVQQPDAVDVACHNAPQQTVISGTARAVEVVADACEEAGAIVAALPVSAPFHSRLLAPVVQPFARYLAALRLAQPDCDVIDNVTALPLHDDIRTALVAQITAPVLFEESVRYLTARGVDTFIQVGPGRSLLDFVKRISPAATRLSYGDAAGSLLA